jgi:CheY-like chemotaxis protein
LRIFIASDDETFRRVAAFLLRRRGFRVVAPAGVLSLASLRETAVDAVLVDGSVAEAVLAASLVHEWHPAAEAVVVGSDDARDKWARLAQAADRLMPSRIC